MCQQCLPRLALPSLQTSRIACLEYACRGVAGYRRESPIQCEPRAKRDVASRWPSHHLIPTEAVPGTRQRTQPKAKPVHTGFSSSVNGGDINGQQRKQSNACANSNAGVQNNGLREMQAAVATFLNLSFSETCREFLLKLIPLFRVYERTYWLGPAWNSRIEQ